MPGNPSHFLLWPVGKETEAEAYRLAANAAAAILMSEPGAVWYPQGWSDAWGQPVVAKFFGGPWRYADAIVPEGPTEIALRANAVEVEDWDRPPEE